MTGCLHEYCYHCKHFIGHINRFENYYVFGCGLYKKYVTKINDVTLVTPDLLLNTGVIY